MKQLFKKHAMILVAIFIAGVTLMSFTYSENSKSKFAENDLHWFQISGSYDEEDSVLSSNASYINSNETPPTGEGCGGSQLQCVSGFTTDQTVVVGGIRMLSGPQAPAEVASFKN